MSRLPPHVWMKFRDGDKQERIELSELPYGATIDELLVIVSHVVRTKFTHECTIDSLTLLRGGKQLKGAVADALNGMEEYEYLVAEPSVPSDSTNGATFRSKVENIEPMDRDFSRNPQEMAPELAPQIPRKSAANPILDGNSDINRDEGPDSARNEGDSSSDRGNNGVSRLHVDVGHGRASCEPNSMQPPTAPQLIPPSMSPRMKRSVSPRYPDGSFRELSGSMTLKLPKEEICQVYFKPLGKKLFIHPRPATVIELLHETFSKLGRLAEPFDIEEFRVVSPKDGSLMEKRFPLNSLEEDFRYNVFEVDGGRGVWVLFAPTNSRMFMAPKPNSAADAVIRILDWSKKKKDKMKEKEKEKEREKEEKEREIEVKHLRDLDLDIDDIDDVPVNYSMISRVMHQDSLYQLTQDLGKDKEKEKERIRIEVIESVTDSPKTRIIPDRHCHCSCSPYDYDSPSYSSTLPPHPMQSPLAQPLTPCTTSTSTHPNNPIHSPPHPRARTHSPSRSRSPGYSSPSLPLSVSGTVSPSPRCSRCIRRKRAMSASSDVSLDLDEYYCVYDADNRHTHIELNDSIPSDVTLLIVDHCVKKGVYVRYGEREVYVTPLPHTGLGLIEVAFGLMAADAEMEADMELNIDEEGGEEGEGGDGEKEKKKKEKTIDYLKLEPSDFEILDSNCGIGHYDSLEEAISGAPDDLCLTVTARVDDDEDVMERVNEIDINQHPKVLKKLDTKLTDVLADDQWSKQREILDGEDLVTLRDIHALDQSDVNALELAGLGDGCMDFMRKSYEKEMIDAVMGDDRDHGHGQMVNGTYGTYVSGNGNGKGNGKGKKGNIVRMHMGSDTLSPLRNENGRERERDRDREKDGDGEIRRKIRYSMKSMSHVSFSDEQGLDISVTIDCDDIEPPAGCWARYITSDNATYFTPLPPTIHHLKCLVRSEHGLHNFLLDSLAVFTSEASLGVEEPLDSSLAITPSLLGFDQHSDHSPLLVVPRM